ncbi:Hsp20/alpha crystallin family protein [Methanolobus profundi]|uniref:HSP20 family protein n=1 Tax=Methanolobus profundi TaxID=487685 RepID=A0A1I4S4P5_9EURY|nr:Hsp20/alpha crystallin family protein [Methanolobus profundi]SFM59482.1 HSP20 family protein [Methanolobus profundi]
MADKRKKRGFIDDIFNEGGFSDIEDIIEHMMERFGFSLDDFEKQPFFYGFSVSGHPGEEPEIREFGNVFQDDEDDDEFESVIQQQFRGDARKTLIDIFEMDDKVYVTVELPDVEKEDIGLNVTETVLELKAESEENSYSEDIELPSSVDPDTARATYLNGVLEVVMDVKELGVARPVHIE